MHAAAEAAVSVVIPVYNAAGTLRQSVASALAEPETKEVIIVDDASTDATPNLLNELAEAHSRLVIRRFERNRGPSAARNLGLSIATGTHVAILDADDFFLPGRLARLAAGPKGEAIADNVVFIAPDQLALLSEAMDRRPRFDSRPMDLAQFIEGNIPLPGRSKRELGYLKPMFTLSFLQKHGLRYREDVRFGEDYDLYVRLLAAGGRFSIVDSLGYVAVIHDGSLSATHRTDDLERLMRLDQELKALCERQPGADLALERHERHVRADYWHRKFLDERRRHGRLGAILRLGGRPQEWSAVVRRVLRDKLSSAPSTDAGRPSAAFHFLLG